MATHSSNRNTEGIFLIINSEAKNRNFFTNLQNRMFQKKSDENARDYLLEYRETYWKETDYRVTEFTKTLETDMNRAVKAGVGVKFPNILDTQFGIDKTTAEKLTEEQKSEIVKYAQPIVDEVQIRKLAEVISFLENELLDDPQKRCFIAIDRLDEPWVNDQLRYKLIKALIETTRYINRHISSVKNYSINT